MVRLSYGHDSKNAIFSWSRRMFYILRTYAYDTWNIFYRLLKSHSSPQTHKEWRRLTELQRLECQKSTWKLLFLDETCIFCHTVMIQRALHSPDLGKCFILKAFAYDAWKNFYRLLNSNSLAKTRTNLFLRISWPHLRLFKVHLNLKNHEKTLRH